MSFFFITIISRIYFGYDIFFHDMENIVIRHIYFISSHINFFI